MKTIIASISDLHLSGKDTHNTLSALEWAIDDMNRRGVDLLLFAGDIFDKPNVGDRYHTVATLRDLMRAKIKKANFKMHAISGQHDYIGGGEKSAINLLSDDMTVSSSIKPTLHFLPGDGEIPRVATIDFPWQYKTDLLEKDEISKSNSDELFYERCLQNARISMDMHDYSQTFTILLGHCIVLGSMVGKKMLRGKFSFTAEQLMSIGTDHIILGDIHKRQGFYNGAFTQRSFGEAGNPCGYRITEIDGKEILDDFFVEVPCKKFYIKTSEEFLQDSAAGKYTEEDEFMVKDFAPPSDGLIPIDLPDNVRFHKISDPEEIRREEVKSNTMHGQFLEFMEVNGEKPDSERVVFASNLLDEILKDTNLVEQSISGSLERINRIRLQNIGPHADLDFVVPDGLTGISGINGVGKTFLLGSIMGVLFGEIPTYPNKIKNRITQGYIGDALAEVEFVSSGNIYKAERKFYASTSSVTQEAWLHKWDRENNKWVAEVRGAEKDFIEKVENLVGKQDQILASTFASQMLDNDLTDMLGKKAGMTFWHELLGLSKYQEIFDVAHKQFTSADSDLKNAIRNAQSIKEEMDAEEDYAKLKSQTSANIEVLKKTREKQKAEWDAHLKEKDGLTAEISTVSAQFSEKEKKEAELFRLQSNLRSMRNDIEMQRRTLSMEAFFLKEQRAHNQSIEDRKELQRMKDAYNEAKSQRDKYDSEFQRMKTEIDKREAKLQNELKAAQKQIDVLTKKIKMSETAACYGNDCSSCGNLFEKCVFVEDARFAVSEKEGLIEEETRIQEALEKRSYITEAEILRGKQLRVLLRQELPEKPDEKVIGRNEVIFHRTKTADAELARITEIKVYVSKVEIQISEAEVKITDLQKEILKFSGETKILDDLRGKKAKVENLIKISQSEHDRTNDEIIDLEKELSRLEVKEKQSAERKDKYLALQKEVEAINLKKEALSLLEKAFGYKGIPQFLIASALPRVQEIVTEILEKLDDPYSIWFITQRETGSGKSKKMKEDFDIILEDHRGSRPLAEYSGGQKQMARLVIRLAIAIYKAEALGGSYKVYVGDEIFTNMNAENSMLTMEVLQSIKGWFNQILIISHNDDYLRSMDQFFEVYAEGYLTKIRQIN